MGIAKTLSRQLQIAGLSLGLFVGFLLEMEATVIYTDF